MTSKQPFAKLLNHVDREEIISKLIIGINPSEIHEWLQAKYSDISEKQLVVSEKMIRDFGNNYLDIYKMVQDDLAKTKAALATNDPSVELSLKNNSAYKEAMIKAANQEVDIRKMMAGLMVVVENNLADIYDAINEDRRNIDTRTRRLFNESIETMGNLIDKYYKYTETSPNPTLTVNHNLSIQAVDQHISVFQDVIRELLQSMDLEASLYFMEVFNEKMAKLKPPSEKSAPTSEMKLAEVKLLNETINKKLNAND